MSDFSQPCFFFLYHGYPPLFSATDKLTSLGTPIFLVNGPFQASRVEVRFSTVPPSSSGSPRGSSRFPFPKWKFEPTASRLSPPATDARPLQFVTVYENTRRSSPRLSAFSKGSTRSPDRITSTPPVLLRLISAWPCVSHQWSSGQ